MRTFAQKPKATQQTSAKPMISGRAHFGQSREVNSILHLQRTIGNQALQRLLQANPDDLEARSITNEVARFSYDFSQTPVHPRSLASAQAKLTVNSPGDIYEQEADRLSEQVVRMPILRLQTAPRPVDSQKLAGPERQPMPGKRLDAHDSEPESEPSIIQEVRASAGQPLPAEARNFMESRFGHSFSNVRVHANGAAGDLAHRLHARAFTIGDRIFFAPGEYQPDRTSGKRLLAHELTHVLQQGNTSRQSQHVQRDGPSCAPEPEWASPSWAGPLPGDPVPGYEQPRDAYTESDRRMFLIALDERIKENHRTAGEFLGDYGSALVDLWAKYATETMAEEAEKSQWSWWGKRLAWVIQESLIVLSGAGALRWLGKGVVETTKLMTSLAADVGFNAAESAGADVPAVRAAIDAKTGELAKELRKHTVDFIGDLEIGTFHANWLGEHKDNLTELVLFRIPPAVPRIPAADVRAAVAQAVVGFLYGEGAALPRI